MMLFFKYFINRLFNGLFKTLWFSPLLPKVGES